MKDWAGKRYWIVGASTGLGRALAAQLSRAGVRLVLSARDAEALTEVAERLPGQAEVVPVDVTDSAAVAAAAEAIGEIDGCVWCAGVYWPQAATNWVPAEVEAMCDVNFTGLARVLGRVVPPMVARGAGHIVIVGSLSSYRGLPGSVGYGASKAGVAAMAESLYMDLQGSGVEVQLVNPGYVRTRLTEKNDFAMPMLMQPEDAARRIWEHMNSDGFRRNFPAPFSLVFRLGNLLPDWLYYRLFA